MVEIEELPLDLPGFLWDRLDEVQSELESKPYWPYGTYPEEWTPARIESDVTAKKTILNEYQGALFLQQCHPEYEDNNGYVAGLEYAIRKMAEVYKDHSDYKEEW